MPFSAVTILGPLVLSSTLQSVTAIAGEAAVPHPYAPRISGPVVLDVSAEAREGSRPLIDPPYPPSVRFDELDAYIGSDEGNETPPAIAAPSLPEGWAQSGGMVFPERMLEGADMIAPRSKATTADLADICAFPDEVPPGIYDYDHRPGGETPRFHTVYLNYTGGVLTSGGENASENISNIARSGHMFPVYTGGETKAIAAAQAVAADFADWAIRVVYLERPPKLLPYTMVMVGGNYSDTTAGPSGGVAPLDCEDFGQRNVCYAFQNGSSATTQANVISQEIAHTFGLGHTSAPDSVMAFGYASTNAGDLGLHDGCMPTIQVQGQGASCVGVNKCHCGVADQQDDKATLFATFAPAGVDLVPPTIALTSPDDGAVFEEGETILVQLDPWDDFGGYGWKLVVEDAAGEVIVDQADYERAMVFDLKGLPPGSYTIKGVITDHADQFAEDAVSVEVLAVAGSSSGTTGGDETGTTGSSDETLSGSSSDGDEAFAEADDGQSGCSCRQTSNGAWGAFSILLLGIAVRRRHRCGAREA